MEVEEARSVLGRFDMSKTGVRPALQVGESLLEVRLEQVRLVVLDLRNVSCCLVDFEINITCQVLILRVKF